MNRILYLPFLAAMLMAHWDSNVVFSQKSLSAEQVARIEGAVKDAMERNKVVGLQVAIGIGGEVAWTAGFGKADLEHPSPVTSETLFRTASISKWMTAAAAMRLVEMGKLDLNVPIQRYCPEFPEKQWPVTAHHLLQHRAGIRHYWGANGEPRDTPEQREILERRSDEERLWMIVRYTDVLRPLKRFKDDPLLFEPGTSFRYTSNGYRLLGCVLQGAAGKPYSEVMRELVMHPAGMAHTWDDDALAVIPGRARGYTRTPSGEIRRSRFRDVSENLPAGGHLSTAADLVRFALAFHQGKLVSGEGRKKMTAAPRGSEQANSYYGYGVTVAKVAALGGRQVLSHGGGQDETRTFLSLIPDSGLAVSTMTNYEPYGSHEPLHLQIAEIVLGGGAKPPYKK